jgi:DNA (cytosine-5)-methyltransferase 1
MPKFVEFFAGGGCARLGLGNAWECLFANDISPNKVATYRANFGPSEMHLEDIREIKATAIPAADLWWASFPCQDHSVAGRGLGFAGERGSLVFEVMRLLNAANSLGTAPKLVALENVRGFLHNTRDFASVATALVSAGYRIGASMIDAADFLPQSRERMIIVAVRNDIAIPEGLAAAKPTEQWHTKALQRAVSLLPVVVARQWHWWVMPTPTAHGLTLADMIDAPGAPDQNWLVQGKTDEMVGKLNGHGPTKLAKAQAAGKPIFGTIMGAKKETDDGSARAFTLRTDGIAGCLLCRTKSGRQQLVQIDGENVGIRDFTPKELARLMGLPTGYKLPKSRNETIYLTGDGLVVPVIRFLAAHLLEPLLAGGVGRPGTAEKPLRARAKRQDKNPVAPGGRKRRGMKGLMKATSVYLWSDELARVHAAAAANSLSFHELTIQALDLLLSQDGQPPIRRYSAGG